MSLRLVSLKEREEGKGYVRVDWFDDHLQAWAGMARRKAGMATSVIVSDDEDGDEPSAEARTSLEFGDWDGDTGKTRPIVGNARGHHIVGLVRHARGMEAVDVVDHAPNR